MIGGMLLLGAALARELGDLLLGDEQGAVEFSTLFPVRTSLNDVMEDGFLLGV
jgi:hypothetical protein